MPNLSIKDVPETWAEALRQRAIRNHRSLQGELMAIVEAAVFSAPATSTDQNSMGGPKAALSVLAGVAPVPVRQGTKAAGHKTVQDVMKELRLKYPEPVAHAPLGRDIIRAERDAR